jgi:hypothetical protein
MGGHSRSSAGKDLETVSKEDGYVDKILQSNRGILC